MSAYVFFLGGWTLLHCCILRKFSGYMYARYASVDMDRDMDGKFYIHGKPVFKTREPLGLLPGV